MTRNPFRLSANKFGLSLQNFYRVEMWGKRKRGFSLERSYLSQYLPTFRVVERNENNNPISFVSTVSQGQADHAFGCFLSFKHVLIIHVKPPKKDLLSACNIQKIWDWYWEHPWQNHYNSTWLLRMGCHCQKHLQWLNRDLSVTMVRVHKKFLKGPKNEKVIAEVPSIFPRVAFSE